MMADEHNHNCRSDKRNYDNNEIILFTLGTGIIQLFTCLPEVRSRMRALDLGRAGIKTAQLNNSSRSPNILFSIFSISNRLSYGHKQNLSIYYNI